MLRKLDKWVCFLPFCAVVSVVATMYYDDGNIIWIAVNLFFSGRLSIGNYALSSKGISFLGQEYVMYAGIDSGEYYNYIDNSYVQSIVIYGIIYTLFLLFMYMYINRRACRKHDYILVLCISLAALTGVIAQHFLQIFMNPFLIALLANHDKCINNTIRIEKINHESSSISRRLWFTN